MKKTPNYEIGDTVNLTHEGHSSIPAIVTSRVFKDGRWRYLVEPYGHAFSVIAPMGSFAINKSMSVSSVHRNELLSAS